MAELQGSVAATLDIPPFLLVDHDEQEKRREYNRAHPAVTMPFMTTATKPAAVESEADMLARFEFEERERIKNEKSLQRLDESKIKRGLKPRPDMRWDNGKWVRSDGMTRAKYTRLLTEMPTDEHRVILRNKYAKDFPGVPERLNGDAAQNSPAKGDIPGTRHAVPTRRARTVVPKGTDVGRTDKQRVGGSNPPAGAKRSRGRKTTY